MDLENKPGIAVFSPALGEYIRQEDLGDSTFSSGSLGAGFGVTTLRKIIKEDFIL